MITLWSLYNSVDKIQIDDLKSEQVRIVLLSIPTVRMKDWMICKKGELHWQSLLQAPEFFDDVRDLKGDTENISLNDLSTQSRPDKFKSQAPPTRRPLFDDINLEAEQTLSLMDQGSNIEVKERRSARRHNKVLGVEISGQAEVFETQTQDVSMSGMNFKDPLPDWVKKKFSISLSFKGRSMKVLCERIDGDSSQTKARILEVEHWEVLKDWVVGW